MEEQAILLFIKILITLSHVRKITFTDFLFYVLLEFMFLDLFRGGRHLK